MTEPEKDHQQEEQPDATEGEVTEDYNLDIDNEGSELKVEWDAQEQRDIDPDAAYAKKEMPRDGTLCHDALGNIHGDIIAWCLKITCG